MRLNAGGGGTIYDMRKTTVYLPESLKRDVERQARQRSCSEAEVIRQAIERYLEDFDDLSVAIDRLRDPSDPVLDWDDVRRELLGQD